MLKQGFEFEYWVQWQVPVCALIFIMPAVIALKYVNKGKRGEALRSFDLWNCCWRHLNPLWLLFYRAFAFVCMAWMLCQMVAIDGPFAFYFYTQWTFALVMIYFAMATVISAYGCWTSTKKTTSDREEELEDDINLRNPDAQKEIHQKVGSWGYVMQAMYHTCAGASILTDLVFWCLLVPLEAGEQFELTLLMSCLHTMNIVFLIGDTALNSLPFTWFGFVYFVFWSCLYITFQWVVHLCGFMTWWPYPFLELNTPWAPLWYLGMALFHVPCFWIYTMLIKAKNSLLPRLFPRVYARLN
ncbi:Protein rolling stone [Parasponia andersonii]|uniref:Protein rolling stone n=1 Tax=Parasponia andersonii TaxID=3476 RepID=A0A2P5B336_PARAD|nr:Protein rolling stone [Parasponia andersonii]